MAEGPYDWALDHGWPGSSDEQTAPASTQSILDVHFPEDNPKGLWDPEEDD